eukprot:862394-Prorocentrum_minimum.AAC.2
MVRTPSRRGPPVVHAAPEYRGMEEDPLTTIALTGGLTSCYDDRKRRAMIRQLELEDEVEPAAPPLITLLDNFWI